MIDRACVLRKLDPANTSSDMPQTCNMKFRNLISRFNFGVPVPPGFVNWISNTLGIERTANQLWTGAEAFDFRIFPTPESLEAAIRAKAAAL